MMSIATKLKEKHELFNAFADIVEVKNQDLLQENANVDGQAPMGQMGKFASESSKFYTREFFVTTKG